MFNILYERYKKEVIRTDIDLLIKGISKEKRFMMLIAILWGFFSIWNIYNEIISPNINTVLLTIFVAIMGLIGDGKKERQYERKNYYLPAYIQRMNKLRELLLQFGIELEKLEQVDYLIKMAELKIKKFDINKRRHGIIETILVTCFGSLIIDGVKGVLNGHNIENFEVIYIGSLWLIGIEIIVFPIFRYIWEGLENDWGHCEEFEQDLLELKTFTNLKALEDAIELKPTKKVEKKRNNKFEEICQELQHEEVDGVDDYQRTVEKLDAYIKGDLGRFCEIKGLASNGSFPEFASVIMMFTTVVMAYFSLISVWANDLIVKIIITLVALGIILGMWKGMKKCLCVYQYRGYIMGALEELEKNIYNERKQ